MGGQSMVNSKSAGPLIKGPPGCEEYSIPACSDFSMPACLYAVFCILYPVVCSHTVCSSVAQDPGVYPKLCSFPQPRGLYVRMYICMYICTSWPPAPDSQPAAPKSRIESQPPNRESKTRKSMIYIEFLIIDALNLDSPFLISQP